MVGGVVHCGACNHREVLAYVQAVQRTEQGINDMTAREPPR